MRVSLKNYLLCFIIMSMAVSINAETGLCLLRLKIRCTVALITVVPSFGLMEYVQGRNRFQYSIFGIVLVAPNQNRKRLVFPVLACFFG